MSAGAGRRRSRGKSAFSRYQRRAAAVLLSAAGGVATVAQPTGLAAVDHLWCAALAAGAAQFGSYARRGPLLVAASLAVVTSPTGLALIPAVIAIVAAATSTVDLTRPTPFLRGVSAGASMCALLAASHETRPAPLVVLSWAAVVGPIVYSGVKRAPAGARRRLVRELTAIGGVSALVSLAAVFGAALARPAVDDGVRSLDAGLVAARAGDIEEARDQLEQASESLDEASQSVGRWGYLARVIPGASQNVRAVQEVLADAAVSAVRAEVASAVTNNEGLSVDGGVLNLQLVRALAGPMNQLVFALDASSDRLDDLEDVPLLPTVRNRLEDLVPDLDRALEEARNGAQAAEVLPGMLGADGPRRYLILFTSPAESRGRFGFPAAYGTLVVDHGTFDLEVAESIGAIQGNVNADQANMPLDDPFVAPYISYGATRNFRSVTVPPDFPTVAALTRELWNQTGRGEIHGVLRVDTTSLASFVEFTGPVPVEGRTELLAADEVTRYLDFDQYVIFGDQAAGQRQEVLETLAETVFDRLLEVDLPGPRGLADELAPMVEQGHLQLVTFDDAGMGFLDEIGLTGRFDEPEAPDGLAVSTVNLVGNKIDAFLQQTIRHDATVAGDGNISATTTISLTNGAPSTGLPDYVIGPASDNLDPPPQGTSQSIVLVWSALPLVSAAVDGVEVTTSSTQSGGWWLHAVTIEIPAGGTRTLSLLLSGPPATDGEYSLHVVPGNLANPVQFTLTASDGDDDWSADFTVRENRVIER